jgi:hypothetical protein
MKGTGWQQHAIHGFRTALRAGSAPVSSMKPLLILVPNTDHSMIPSARNQQ